MMERVDGRILIICESYGKENDGKNKIAMVVASQTLEYCF